MFKLSVSFMLLLFLSACGSGEQNVESCLLDTPENATQLPINQDFRISGWAYDKKTASSPEQVNVELHGNESKVFVAKRVSRPDVAKELSMPGAEMSGYELIVPANSLVEGMYEITIAQETPERKTKCFPNRMIEITGPITPVALPSPVVTPTATSVPEVMPVPSVVAPIKESKELKKEPKITKEIVITQKAQKKKTEEIEKKKIQKKLLRNKKFKRKRLKN